jgi:hypothetical protein
LISVVSLVVAVIIGLCVVADWLGHLGWGYAWPVVPFLIVFIAVAVVINRGASVLIMRASN